MSQVHPHCPKCKTTKLVEKTLSDETTKIDICPDCKGGWFDGGELETVLSVAIKDLAPPEAAEKTSRVCPKCLIPLSQIRYPVTSIMVDVCEDCRGIWLDRGEFQRLNENRAKYQDKSKFAEPDETEPPKNFKDATARFITKIIDRFIGQ